VFSKQQAIDLVSFNLEELLGLKVDDGPSSLSGREKSWVAWEGDWFSINARVRGVKALGSETVDLF
jgi:hypothetical protein